MGWLFYRRVKTDKAFYRPMNRVVHAHLRSLMPEDPRPDAPVFLGGGARPNARFQALCGLAGIKPSLWIDLEERLGVLAAGVSKPGWLEALNADERRTLADAVAGLYKLSGVQWVHIPGDPLPDSPAGPVIVTESPSSMGPIDFAAVTIPWRAWVGAWNGVASRTSEADEPPWRAGILPEPAPRCDRIGRG